MKAAQVVMVMVMGAADVMVLFMMEAASRQRVRILFHKCDLFCNCDCVAQVPQYNWTISESGEEITVMADRSLISSYIL